MSAPAPIDVKAFFAGREAERQNFLKSQIKGDLSLKIIGADWASRRYFRVFAGYRTYVLMETVPDHIPTATMGHKLSAFLRIATMLHSKGIHTPDIIAVEEGEGLVLLEDFGDTSVHMALERGDDPMPLYNAATDVLTAMRDAFTLDDLCGFSKYKDSYIRKGMQRIVDWYIPFTREETSGDDLLPSYLQAWADVSAQLPPPPIGFIHGDFHVQNLMLLPDGTCGVLDFQDAMAGPLPYDLANLLENIRRDVPRDIHEAMMKRYGADDTFRAWFRVMAAQFHCRIIGQVFRLALVSGKTDLLQYLPRIQNYIVQGLKDPVLRPLADWMAAERVDFTVSGPFDLEKARKFIRPDAF